MTDEDNRNLHSDPDEYLNQRYSPEVRAAIIYSPLETHQTYLDRLHQTFPGFPREDVIDGVWQVALAGVGGRWAFQIYQKGQTLPDAAHEYFPVPPDTATLQPGTHPKLIHMNPEKAAEVIAACNVAAVHTEQLGAKILTAARDRAINIVLGREYDPSIPFTSALKLKGVQLSLAGLASIYGDAVYQLGEEEMRRIVEQTITLKSLKFPIDLMTQEFRHVTRTVSPGPYDVTDMLVTTATFAEDIDMLRIHPSVVLEMRKTVFVYLGFAS